MRIVMGLGVACVLLLSACTSSHEGGADESGSASVEHFAFEYSWREQTTTQEWVEQPYVCQGVIYCENPFPRKELVTVPGRVATRTDYVCATSLDEARSKLLDGAPADATVTGTELDPGLCSHLEEQPPKDVDESEVDNSEADEPEVQEPEVEAGQYDVDEEAALEEYIYEGEMYDRELLAGYSQPLSVALAHEQREDVRKVQRWLRQQGFSPGAVDGYYGKSTARAVRWFQRYVGLSVDGVVGKDTWSALNQGLGY